ncbi:MAG: hypothetical protein EAZ16_02600 [Sphingobacteriales bacterium]|nr:MAG: hypothetical protein EAZ16_02600 [Sphingobacteriales bacterium]
MYQNFNSACMPLHQLQLASGVEVGTQGPLFTWGLFLKPYQIKKNETATINSFFSGFFVCCQPLVFIKYRCGLHNRTRVRRNNCC